MATFAVLDDNNVIENTIMAETLEIAEELTGKTCIEYAEDSASHIGGTYDSKKKVFILPPQPEPTPIENINLPVVEGGSAPNA